MNDIPMVNNIEELRKATTIYVQVVCPVCRTIYTSLVCNAENVLNKGCVPCTEGTANEWHLTMMGKLAKDVNP